jgi:hypothetical protein
MDAVMLNPPGSFSIGQIVNRDKMITGFFNGRLAGGCVRRIAGIGEYFKALPLMSGQQSTDLMGNGMFLKIVGNIANADPGGF